MSEVYDLGKKKVLNICIPRTGSTSICKAFNATVLGHHDYNFFIQHNRGFDFSFAFVRNPLSRVHSAYYYLKAGGVNYVDRDDWKKYCAPFKGFEHFIMEGLYACKCLQQHFKPQFTYVCKFDAFTNKHCGPVAVDFIGKFESLQKDFDTLCGMINKEKVVLGHYNKCMHDDMEQGYTKEMESMVKENYKHDFELFNYEK